MVCDQQGSKTKIKYIRPCLARKKNGIFPTPMPFFLHLFFKKEGPVWHSGKNAIF